MKCLLLLLLQCVVVSLESLASTRVECGGSRTTTVRASPHTCRCRSSSLQQATSLQSIRTHQVPASSKARGVIYDDLERIKDLRVAWACNWKQEAGVSDHKWEYVPQLWGPPQPGQQQSTGVNIAHAKSVLFYNEPDINTSVGGSQVPVDQAAADWIQYMVPIQKSGKRVSTPCVANSGGYYMIEFLQKTKGWTMDILCMHWYGNTMEDLISTVQEFSKYKEEYNIREVWISEFAFQSSMPPDVSRIWAYLEKHVDRFAYNLMYWNAEDAAATYAVAS